MQDEETAGFQCGDQSGETLLQKCCSDLAVNESRAMEIIEWAQENTANKKAISAGMIHHAVGFEKMARVMVQFENSWLGIRLLFYALDNPAIDDVLGHKIPAEFAREQDCTRANATKLLKRIQDALGLPPRKGQRTESTRTLQREVRKSQLK